MEQQKEYGAVVTHDGMCSLKKGIGGQYDFDTIFRPIFVQHLAKLHMQDNMGMIKNDTQTTNAILMVKEDDVFKTALQELEAMKTTKVFDDTTMFWLLVCGRNKLRGLARNAELLGNFDKLDKDDRFPLHYPLIRSRLAMPRLRATLLPGAERLLAWLTKLHPTNNNVVIEHVIHRLSDADLQDMHKLIELLQRK